MHRLLIAFYFSFSFLFYDYCLNAQCSHSLETVFLEEQSNAIFEGTVINQFSDWSDDGRIIITWNEILVKKSIKGKTADHVFVATKGGKINDIGCEITPSLTLNIGDTGIFHTMHLKDNNYKTTAAQQSFIPNETFETDQKSQQVIVISSISPATVAGGIGEVMTINGSGFGNLNPPAKIQFRNPDVFLPAVSYQTVDPNLILSWNNTQIQVLVPGKDVDTGKAGAGSGEIRIINELGEILQSTQNIVVSYNKITNNGVEIDLVNDDSNGGYTFAYNSDFNTNSSATAAFERALDSWNCDAQSNIRIAASTTSNNCPTQDNINSIGFDNGCSLPLGTLAETIKWYSVCGNGVSFFTEMDIVFANALNWNYGPGATSAGNKDFETLCLHELGHIHGIEHVINEGSTMYPSLANGIDLRIIDSNSLVCAQAIFDHSTQTINCGGQTPFQTSGICVSEISAKVLLEGPYLTNGLMNTFLSTLIPNNQPYSSAPYNYVGTESFTTLPANTVDWVLVEMRTGTPTSTPEIGTTVIETVAGLLLSDGNIVDPSTGGPLKLRDLIEGNSYYICVRHRTHLDVLGSQPMIAEAVMSYDFTTSTTKAFGSEQQKMLNGSAVLFVGDYSQDGIIQTTDIDLWVANPALLNTYSNIDGNLDGVVQTTDYDAWFINKAKVGSDEIGF